MWLFTEQTPVSILVNRKKWAEFFGQHEILHLFWSAKAASATLEGKKLSIPWSTNEPQDDMDDLDAKIYGRDELLARLQYEAEQIAKKRITTNRSENLSLGGSTNERSSSSVMVGFVGYPNVGKSSTINALVGQKRAGVTSTPGKTKHFQTMIISDKLTLCDCPGLVFPSFSSSRYEMIAYGVLPIDRMTEHREAIQVVADRVPRHVIENVYNINLPKPKPHEPQSRPPLASELLKAYCVSRGHVVSSGLPDETRASRQILKDYVDGKIPHYELPPGMSNEDDIQEEDAVRSDTQDSEEDSNLEDVEESSNVGSKNASDRLEHVTDYLDSFDMANGLTKPAVPEKKPQASHKHHKKPQRKKDRSWRVGNDDGDGMPAIRVFQKPINSGLLKVVP